MSIVKRLLIVSSILMIVGLVGIALTAKSHFKKESLMTEKIKIEESYDDLLIQVNNIGIELLPTEESVTTIDVKIPEGQSIDTAVKKDVLTINLNDQSLPQRLSSYIFSEVPKVTVHIPDETYNDIRITSTNGMVSAEDLNVGQLSIKTVNGYVRLQTIDARESTVITENGLIELREMTGNLISHSTNGMISYEASTIDQPIDFKTVNGLISIETLQKPKNASFNLSVDFGRTSVFGDSGNKLVYGAGENIINLTTSLGQVTVDLY